MEETSISEKKQPLLDKIQDVSFRRGIAYPTGEIYGGLSGAFDYGPLGTLMRLKLINFWREYFVKDENHFEVEGSLIIPEKVFEASGHLAKFNDPLVQCKSCKSMFRADMRMGCLQKNLTKSLVRTSSSVQVVREIS
ncbi:MAG: hypothetical protein ACTSPC_09930 [Candidatus Heimdallarchaeota archaeon]